jgi:hypothetical protein
MQQVHAKKRHDTPNRPPSHRHPVTECAHKFLWQRHVTHEEGPDAGVTGGFQHAGNLSDDRFRIFDLL